jgi:hypothetical protein
VSRQKVYGRRERFSQEFAINLKKLRNGRFSEYIPRKHFGLNADSDVQPQIVTLRESYVEQRKRTESCYPRLGHQKSQQELFSLSENREGSLGSQQDEPDDGEQQEVLSESEGEKFRTGFTYVNCRARAKKYQEDSQEFDGCRTHDFERSAVEEEPRGSMSCMEELQNEKKAEIFSRCRSLDSVSVSINGKIFKYFDKAQLCSIPVITFKDFIKKLETLKVSKENLWLSSSRCASLCCFKSSQLEDSELSSLERLIQLFLTDLDPCNDFHLTLLLGAYTSITGEKDWPSHDKDWLRLGFSSIDLKTELNDGGLFCLFFLFFLSESFAGFLNDLLKVSIYYSFEVFEVLKQFIKDSMFLLRSRKIHCCLNQKGKSLERFLLFTCGMVQKWFKLIVLNKDFRQMHRTVIAQARSAPIQFIQLAENSVN